MRSKPGIAKPSTWVAGALALGAASAALNVVQFARARTSKVDLRTGLLAFDVWDELARRSLDRVARTQSRAGLLMIDIDDLKAVNDTFGHLRGDETIAQVGATLRGCLRQGDLATRFGGDEFAVFIPAAGDAECRRIGARIHACLALADTPSGMSSTVSIGYTVYPADGSDLPTLMKRADAGLYAAKAAGGAQTKHGGDSYVVTDATSRSHPSTS